MIEEILDKFRENKRLLTAVVVFAVLGLGLYFCLPMEKRIRIIWTAHKNSIFHQQLYLLIRNKQSKPRLLQQ